MTGRLLIDMHRGQCRFAIGEEPGASYCAEHAAVCFDRRPAEKRERIAEQMLKARAARPGAVIQRVRTNCAWTSARTRGWT